MATEREQFDADIERAKRGLYKNPGEAKIYSRERGLAPGMAAKRLEERGVDVRGLIANELTDSDYKKGGKVKSAKYMSFSKSGKPAGMKSVSKMSSGGSASSRADGIAQRGKTKGRMC